jgi:hypothetical protein
MKACGIRQPIIQGGNHARKERAEEVGSLSAICFAPHTAFLVRRENPTLFE